MSFHTYRINEIYSSADGLVQFVEIEEAFSLNGQHRWLGHTLKVTQGNLVHSFPLSDLISSNTRDTTVLLATQGFADLGIVTPDFILPAGFLFTSGGTLNFAEGTSTVSYGQLPADGTHSLNASGVSAVATPRNFAGAHGSLPEPNHLPTGAVSITGDLLQGQVLSANTSMLADADGLGTLSLQWKAAGVAINGATASSFTLGESQVGKIITLTASYTDQRGTAESVTSSPSIAVLNVNDQPTGGVTISGTARQGQTLSAFNTVADLDGIPPSGAGSISYQWKADGATIAGATASTLVLAEAQVGKAITVTASYTDNHGTPESVPSLPSNPVENVNDVHTGGVSISGTLEQGRTLNASSTLVDADGLGTLSYQWKADGASIDGATTSTLVLAEAQVGKTISVSASYTDNHGTPESATSAPSVAVANVNDEPTGAVAVSGTPTLGQTLNASNTLVDADGPGTVSYQWSANDDLIVGATGSSFVMTDEEVGRIITVSASYTDGHGTHESVTGGFPKAVEVLAYSWKAHTLLSGVQVSGADHNGSSDANGLANLDGMTNTAPTLAASRAIQIGDEAGATASAVNLQDAIAILKMIVGLDVNAAGKPLSPYQALAADFDGSGTVGLSDAIGVLKHVVGLPSPDRPTWHFANEADLSVREQANAHPGAAPRIVADLGGSGPFHVGLVGYLSGDVDGSFGGGGTAHLDASYFDSLVLAHPGLNLSQFGL